MAPLKQQPAHYIIVGGKRLPLIVKKHPRARNLVVRYDMQSECVRVTIPRYVALKHGLEFAEKRRGWLEKQIGKRVPVRFTDGAVIPLFGEDVTLSHIGGRGMVALSENILHVTGESEFMPRRVRDFIIKEMRLRAQSIATHYANGLGVKVSSIRIGDMRSLWGSCSRKGNLSLSLRLAFTPPEVMDYVICHEVSHIKHPNHSAAFWKTVESLCADFERHEAWLRHHGSAVWAYG